MRSDAATPDEYILALPDDRRTVVSAVRDAINAALPDGFQEGIAYGMIGWSVPHSIYPKGYHVDPSRPLGMIALASQKNHIAVYHHGLYPGTKLHEWFVGEWPKHSAKKLDLGKSCLRFKKPEDIPLELISSLAGRMTPEQWVHAYESMLNGR
jgi:uncharacterized protein YdhG (YjbR/CyaY superfamily)